MAAVTSSSKWLWYVLSLLLLLSILALFAQDANNNHPAVPTPVTATSPADDADGLATTTVEASGENDNNRKEPGEFRQALTSFKQHGATVTSLKSVEANRWHGTPAAIIEAAKRLGKLKSLEAKYPQQKKQFNVFTMF